MSDKNKWVIISIIYLGISYIENLSKHSLIDDGVVNINLLGKNANFDNYLLLK